MVLIFAVLLLFNSHLEKMMSEATPFNAGHLDAFWVENQNDNQRTIDLLRKEAAKYRAGATAHFTEGEHKKGCEKIINALAHLSLALKIQSDDIETTF